MGQRAAPLVDLPFKPGFVTVTPPRSAKARWKDGNRVRFHRGFPELMGGWIRADLTGANDGVYLGAARGCHDWYSLDGQAWLGFGTHSKLYVVNNGVLYDITPYRRTSNLAEFPVTFTAGLLVAATTGTLSSAWSRPTGGYLLTFSNGDVRLVYVTQGDTAAAWDTGLSSGATATADCRPFQTTNASTTVTINEPDHRCNSGDYIQIADASAVGGITLTGQYQVTVVTPHTYTVTAGTAATSSATGGGAPSMAYEIRVGFESNDELLGFGAGLFGAGTFGTPRAAGTGIPAKMRTWSLWNWGEDLIASYNDGELYWWDRTLGPRSRATLVTGAPENIQRMIVNQQDQTVLLLGCTNLTGDPDAMRLRWCSEGDFTDWIPTETNTAGGKRLDYGSRMVASILSRGQILMWSDTHMYAAAYVGGTEIYSVGPLGAVKIVGPNAAVDVNGATFFMGFKDFYIYDGGIRVMPCEVWNKVFDEFDDSQAEKVYASSFMGKSEVRWEYPRIDGTMGYVCYSYGDDCWYYGDVERTAYHDASTAAGGTMTNPYGFNDGGVYIHEWGTDEIEWDGTDGQAFYLESWDFDAQSDKHFLVNMIVPEFSRLAVGIQLTLRSKPFPQTPTYIESGPYVIDEDTTQLDVRARGSQMSILLEPQDDGDNPWTGTDFRLGVLQWQPTPYGGR